MTSSNFMPKTPMPSCFDVNSDTPISYEHRSDSELLTKKSGAPCFTDADCLGTCTGLKDGERIPCPLRDETLTDDRCCVCAAANKGVGYSRSGAQNYAFATLFAFLFFFAVLMFGRFLNLECVKGFLKPIADFVGPIIQKIIPWAGAIIFTACLLWLLIWTYTYCEKKMATDACQPSANCTGCKKFTDAMEKAAGAFTGLIIAVALNAGLPYILSAGSKIWNKIRGPPKGERAKIAEDLDPKREPGKPANPEAAEVPTNPDDLARAQEQAKEAARSVKDEEIELKTMDTRLTGEEVKVKEFVKWIEDQKLYKFKNNPPTAKELQEAEKTIPKNELFPPDLPKVVVDNLVKEETRLESKASDIFAEEKTFDKVISDLPEDIPIPFF